MKPVRTDGGTWMDADQTYVSIARVVAIDCMRALGYDSFNDFKTRDKIIMAISDNLNSILDRVAKGTNHD